MTDPLANAAGPRAPSVAPHRRIRPDGLAERLAALAGRVAISSGSEPPDPVVSPLDGSPLGAVPRCGIDDVGRAAAAARIVQEDWSRRAWAERAEPFLRFHDLLLERQDEILDIIQLETAKARKHAFEEVADAAIVARHYAHHGEEILAPRRRKGALPGLTTAWEYRHPKGVVGLIAPWNYPLSLSVSDAIPALLAGNAVLVKPDRQTPFTALWAFALLAEAGLPAGLVQMVTGAGSELGPALVAACDYLSFTGSTATGRRVARQAGERLIGCSLELGGKNPMLVLPDADLDAAVEGAVRGAFSNSGQLCISIERIYVHDELFRQFTDRFVRRTRGLRLGVSLDYESDMGGLASADQLAKVDAHVRDAVAEGAEVRCGGRARPDLAPFYYEPTILTGVTPAMALYAEETFGPVVSLYPYASLHDAIERANASQYGLNASIWTADLDLAMRVATRLECGTVNVNEAYAAAWASVDSPMGGFKDSGLGRRHGVEGILKFTEAQTVAVQRGLPIGAPPGVADELFSRAMSQALRVLNRVPGLR
ncbi:MAG TPA: succinic semialdehyde dehydrogenase [Thermoanaerobaculia bacterium]|nr:succinic semialdehyde dehydrogenase [Thermoanaerobaculia bacterium]